MSPIYIHTTVIPVPPMLPAMLDTLHDAHGRRDVETVRGGTQVNLAICPFKAVRRFIREMLPVDLIGIWTTRIALGGFHVTHNHPQGERSGVYYVRTGPGGDLQVGDDTITPAPGMMIVFDSSVPHGTTPFEGTGTRLTMAFDYR